MSLRIVRAKQEYLPAKALKISGAVMYLPLKRELYVLVSVMYSLWRTFQKLLKGSGAVMC